MVAVNAKISKSFRSSGETIIADGYVYNKGSDNQYVMTVYCNKRNTAGCLARGRFMKLTGRLNLIMQHNHPAVPGEIIVDKKMVSQAEMVVFLFNFSFLRLK